MQKLFTFFSKNISIYAILNKRFNDTLTNNIVSFKQLGPGFYLNITQNDKNKFYFYGLYGCVNAWESLINLQ